MNFSSHQNKLIESIEIALRKDKLGIIGDFKSILSQAKKLYKTDALDFWMTEIGSHSVAELAMTKYGHKVATSSIKHLKHANRNTVASSLSSICESLFTYCNDDDMCILQGDYHYYYSLDENTVYKHSELGIIEGLSNHDKESKCRVALKSELSVNDSEWLE